MFFINVGTYLVNIMINTEKEFDFAIKLFKFMHSVT